VLYPELTVVVVMTSKNSSDVRGLLGVVKKSFPFIGVMGSQAKIAQIFKDLQAAGIAKNLLSRIFAPVGLQINSHTPEEIAISIAAQILKERYTR
ncbi:MAG: XdhC family protein, partial [bacterium]